MYGYFYGTIITYDFTAIPVFIIVPELSIVIMDQKQMPPKDPELEPTHIRTCIMLLAAHL